MDGVYVRVVAINIVNATLTLASLVIGDDASSALKAAAKTAAIGRKAVQLAGGVQNSQQFGHGSHRTPPSLAQASPGNSISTALKALSSRPAKASFRSMDS